MFLPSLGFWRRWSSPGSSVLVQGGIIAKLKVPAFIVTLGGSFIVRGVALLLSENTTVIGLPRGIRDYGNESLIYLVRGKGGGVYFFHRPEVTSVMLRSMDRIFTYPVVITAIITIIAIFVLKKTAFGRYTYAIGGNQEAALRAGIPGRSPYHHVIHAVGHHRRYRRFFVDPAFYRWFSRNWRQPCCSLRSPRSSSVG